MNATQDWQEKGLFFDWSCLSALFCFSFSFFYIITYAGVNVFIQFLVSPEGIGGDPPLPLNNLTNPSQQISMSPPLLCPKILFLKFSCSFWWFWSKWPSPPREFMSETLQFKDMRATFRPMTQLNFNID